MRKSLLLTFTFFLLQLTVFSQSCVPTNLNNTVVPLSCNSPCINLSFKVPHLKSTGDYAVTTIPYNPFQWVVATGGTEDAVLYADDKYSALYTLPFAFCFY